MLYCNCDDPFESNFFKYFVLNFRRLGLKRLITTSYKPSPVANTQLGLFGDDKTIASEKGRPKVTANKFVINDVGDVDGDGSFSLEDIAKQLKENKNNEWAPLRGHGDFRSPECIELLKQSDIVVTNPPFSLFREYIGQLIEYDKKFLIIGNMNAITYKEVFPLIKSNKIWLGNNAKVNGGAMFYEIPASVANLDQVREIRENEQGRKVYITRVQGVRWFTNLEHGRRHEAISLMSMEQNKKFNNKVKKSDVFYKKYDNYDAIEVSFVDGIPNDYDGVMGVPISFLDKYSPEQFEILGMCENEDLYKMKTRVYDAETRNKAYFDKFGRKGSYDLNASGVLIVNGLFEKVYQRILIKHRKATT